MIDAAEEKLKKISYLLDVKRDAEKELEFLLVGGGESHEPARKVEPKIAKMKSKPVKAPRSNSLRLDSKIEEKVLKGLASGKKVSQIAKECGISLGSVYNIKKGRQSTVSKRMPSEGKPTMDFKNPLNMLETEEFMIDCQTMKNVDLQDKWLKLSLNEIVELKERFNA